MADASIYVGGVASTYKDIAEGETYDLLIAALASLSLILLIMIFLTRSLVAALVIVGTVVLSLGASFGLSVLVWQYMFGVPLFWIVLPLAIILLLAVGADYNLLLISRFKEEIGAGLNTGIIRSMAGTGGWSPRRVWCSPSPCRRSSSATYGCSARSAPPSAWGCCSTP